MSFLYFFIYKTRFYLFQNKSKNLDLSYKIDLDFFGLFYKIDLDFFFIIL